MAWSASGVFKSFLVDTLAGTAVFDLNSPSDVYKASLYDTNPTPDKDATSANSAYGAGVWVSGELSDADSWAATGRAIDSIVTNGSTANRCTVDAADEVSGTTCSITAAYGCLFYNDTKTTPVADQAVCFNYFGGPVTVSNGTLTLAWHVDGIFYITV